MRCRSCEAMNRDGARFCAACGGALAETCAGCGRDLAPGARFCDGCGRSVTRAPAEAPAAPAAGYTPRHLAEGVLSARSARDGERKQVTVMFVDVKGSVGLSARVDSEDWHEVMDRFFALAGEAVHRFEGTVNQYTGDGIMALFGAPVAYEDHAVRAGLAALALRERLEAYREELRRERGLDFAVRVGIHSGEVVVGSIGDDLRRDYTAQGYTVGIAARVQSLAAPGEIWLSEENAALAGAHFELEDLGAHELAGARGPVRLLRLLGARRARRAAAPAGELVGRDAELGRLEAALERARRGRGHTVGLVGDAGLGKSRLAGEFLARCRGRQIPVYDASCVAHGEGRPYLPIVELARAALGIREDEPVDGARARVEHRLAALDPTLAELLPVALEFLELADPTLPALSLDPAARRRLLVALLQALVDDASAAGPAVIAVDDVHWIDESSAQFLEQLTEAVETRPLVLLATFRPGFRAPWMERASYEQIALDPLPTDAASALLHELLGLDPSVKGLSQQIAERAAGNPLFAEEMVASLASAGVLAGERGRHTLAREPEQVDIPPTVQALLAARVDRLSETDKRVLQVAAVIGSQVDPELVTGVVELDPETVANALESLQRARVLSVEGHYPRLRYAFRHPLIREVTYRAQLREPRARLHGAVALQLERGYGREANARGEAIAHHHEAAGHPLEAARWLRRFTAWLGHRDLRAALVSARRLRALLERAPESAETQRLRLSARSLLVGVGYQAGLAEGELAEALREATELAERGAPGAERELAMIHSSYGQSRLHRGDVPGAIAATERAVGFARASGDRDLEHSLATSVVFLLRATGRLREALAVAEQALATSEGKPDWGLRTMGHRVATLLLHRRGALLCDTGRAAEGLEAMEQAAGLAREQDDRQILCWQLHDRIWLAELLGPTRGLGELADEALAIAERRGSDSMLAQAFAARGAALRIGGRFEEAAPAFEQALAISSEHGAARVYDPQCLAALAEARCAAGDAAGAEAALDRALASAAALGSPSQEIRAQAARVRIRLGAGEAGLADAAEALARAAGLAAAIDAAGWEPTLAELRAALSAARGDGAARDAELARAAALWHAMGDPERAASAASEPIRALGA